MRCGNRTAALEGGRAEPGKSTHRGVGGNVSHGAGLRDAGRFRNIIASPGCRTGLHVLCLKCHFLNSDLGFTAASSF